MPQPLNTAARTAHHQLPFLFPGQAQKEAFVNEALVRLDTLTQLSIIDVRAGPPDNPVSGDSYIVAAVANGVWSDYGNAVAVWAENQWLFSPPRPGMRAYHQATKAFTVYDPSEGWQRVAAPPAPSGGGVQDTEARVMLVALVAGLRKLGIFA